MLDFISISFHKKTKFNTFVVYVHRFGKKERLYTRPTNSSIERITRYVNNTHPAMVDYVANEEYTRTAFWMDA